MNDDEPEKTIFLDRDGVINQESPEYIKSPEEWEPIEGSLEAIARLTKAGFRLFVVTNQSGVRRGYFEPETLNAIHEKMLNQIEAEGGNIEQVLYCPHTPDDHCHCRKPETGLFELAAQTYHIDLTQSYVIGDSWRDMKAGLAIGANTILVMTGNGEKAAANHKKELDNTVLSENLAKAADYLLAQSV